MTPDPQPLRPEALPAQAAFLRSLARGLALGDLEAEDLVQETLVKALEHPPRQPGALRAWLGRVARGLAWKARRGAMRRERRERTVALAETAPSPVEILGCQEELLALVTAVRTLPDPLRVAIHLRYFEGLPPPAIARRLGEPLDTVKYRLKRALARLRELLDESHGGERRAWLQGLAPLLAPWAPTVEASCGAAAGLEGSVAPIVLGGLAMKKMLFAGVMLLCAGLLLVTGLLLPGWDVQAGDPDGAGTPLAAEGRLPAPPELPPDPGRKILSTEDPEDELWTRNLALLDLPKQDSLPVVVVDAATGAPVPGAEVAYLFGREKIDPVLDLLADGDQAPEELVWREGRRFVADEEGRVQLPRIQAVLAVAARKGELQGFFYDRGGFLVLNLAGLKVIEVKIAQPFQAKIQVTDQAGKPRAGVPVRLRAEGWGFNAELWRGSTAGADGIALVRCTSFAIGCPATHLHVYAGFQPLLGATGEVLMEQGSAEPVRLILPPTGEARILLEDLPEDLPEQECRIELGMWRLQGGVRTGPQFTPMSIHATGRETLLPFVPLGLDLELRPWFISGPGRGDGGPGPATPGERVTFRVAPGEPAPSLRGRAVDPDGRPLAGALLAAISTARIVSPIPMRTDGNGRFTLRRLPEGGARRTQSLGLVHWLANDGNGRPVGPQAILPWPEPLHPAGIDLGEVVFRDHAPRLLVSGTVLDQGGRPIPGASVRVFGPWKAMGIFASEKLQADSSPDGGFKVWDQEPSNLKPGLLRVEAACPGYAGDSRLDFVPGSEGLVLTLRKLGSIEVEFRLDPEIPPRSVSVSYEPPPDLIRIMKWMSDTKMRISELSSGIYAVQVMAGTRVLARVDGVVVEEGRTTRDPRLLPVDLRGRLRLLKLKVVDGRGAPISQIWMTDTLQMESRLETRPDSSRSGRRQALVPAETRSLVVGAQGFRPRLCEPWGEEERLFILEQGIQVTVTTRPPSPSIQLKARLEALSGGASDRAAGLPGRSRLRSGGEMEPGGGRRYSFVVPAPGRYRLRWYVELGKDLPQAEPAILEVRDSGEQVFPVPLAPAELEALGRR